jgi:hypothetical protein
MPTISAVMPWRWGPTTTDCAMLFGRPQSPQPARLGYGLSVHQCSRCGASTVNGTSHWPIEDPLGLGIVPQQIALMSDNTFISASLRFSIPGDDGLLTSRVRLASSYLARVRRGGASRSTGCVGSIWLSKVTSIVSRSISPKRDAWSSGRRGS